MTKSEHKILKGLWSQTIKSRDNSICVRCGSVKKVAASHIYPKGRYRHMAYDLDNGVTLCFACHMGWWHKHPMDAYVWAHMYVGDKILAKLRARSLKKKVKLNFETIKDILINELRTHNQNT